VFVERNLRQPDAAIADTPKDKAARDRLAVVRRNSDEPAVLILESVADELDRLDAALAEYGNG
jgi:hypothetical protein